MNRKSVLTIVCIITVLLMALSINVYVRCKENEKKAKEIAVKHLEAAYSEQMDYTGIRRGWIDPDIYHVFFNVKKNPDISFEVRVGTDFRLLSDPDDYLLEYFAYYFSDEIRKMTEMVWEEKTVYRGVIFGFESRVAEELHENMPVREMEPYIGEYSLAIDIKKTWDDTEKDAEACRMYEVIKKVQESGYLPESISFHYQSGGEEIKSFWYEEWYEIKDVSQVKNMLD